PQSNGMAERFVKTMKEDYIAFMPKPDVRTALRNLAAAGIVNLRYKSCPEMAGQDQIQIYIERQSL
uniref:hypothetical protein n=1 Tax=Enterobacter asburiae TaxID=61645 RepID=UPI002A80E30F